MSGIDALRGAFQKALSDGIIVETEWSALQFGLEEAAASDANGVKTLIESPLLNAANAVVVPSVLEKIEKKLKMFGVESAVFGRLKARAEAQQKLAEEIYQLAKGETPTVLTKLEWETIFDPKIHPQWGTIGVGALQLFVRRAIDEKIGIESTALRFMGDALVKAGLNQALVTEAQALKVEAAAPTAPPAEEAAPAVDPEAEARRKAAATARRKKQEEERKKADEARKKAEDEAKRRAAEAARGQQGAVDPDNF